MALAEPLLPAQVAAANRLHDRLSQWQTTDRALNALAKRFPEFSADATLLKVVAVNALYKTNVYAVERMAEHVRDVFRKTDLGSARPKLVERLADLRMDESQRRSRRHRSFASKFAHFFVDSERFPIMDNFAVEMVTPDMRLSDNFYGWAKASYELLGFVFASGKVNGKKLEVVQWRIGGPRDTDMDKVTPGDIKAMHRALGIYLSARDQVHQAIRMIEAENIEDENGVPFLVIYGISGNAHRFWSLVNAFQKISYQPEDDSQVRFADQIAEPHPAPLHVASF